MELNVSSHTCNLDSSEPVVSLALAENTLPHVLGGGELALDGTHVFPLFFGFEEPFDEEPFLVVVASDDSRNAPLAEASCKAPFALLLDGRKGFCL